MEAVVGVSAAKTGGRGHMTSAARVSVKANDAPLALTSNVSGVDEARVIGAFGKAHGFPVRKGKVAWSSMTETLERMRLEALAAG